MIRPKTPKRAPDQEILDYVDLTPESIQRIQSAVFLYKGRPVITLPQMDQVHGRPPKTAAHAFRRHRKKMVLGKHYTTARMADLEGLDRVSKFDTRSNKRGHKGEVILLYRRGYLLLVKSFGDDLAWQVQEALVDAFERLEAREVAEAEAPAAVSAAELKALRLTISELKEKLDSLVALQGVLESLAALDKKLSSLGELKEALFSTETRFINRISDIIARNSQEIVRILRNDAINGRYNLRQFFARELARTEANLTSLQASVAPASLGQQVKPSAARARMISLAWQRLIEAWWTRFASRPQLARQIISLAEAGLFDAEGNPAMQFATVARECEGTSYRVEGGAVAVRLRRGAGAPRMYWLEPER